MTNIHGTYLVFLAFFTFSCAQSSDFSQNERKKGKTPIETSDAEKTTTSSIDQLPDITQIDSSTDGIQEEQKPENMRVLEFKSSKIIQTDITVSADSIENKSTITMERKKAVGSDVFTQNTRVPASDRFDQGHPQIDVTETFRTDVSHGALDVLLVVDNSGSMKQEQQNLSDKLSYLLGAVKDAKWQIAIISTDSRDTCYRALIKKGDANPAETFKSVINALGTNGSGTEQGLLMAHRGLSCKNWLQPDSSVAVLVVSDEDNCSKGCKAGSPGGPGSLSSYLDSIRPPASTGLFGIIDVPSAAGGSTCSSAYNVGLQYQAEIQMTGGYSGNICDASYANTLSTISNKIQTLINKEYRLKETPLPGSLTVTVAGNNYTDFTLTDKKLVLNGNPPPNADVVAKYKTREDTIKTSFKLSRSDVALEGLRVVVNGAQQDPNSYAVTDGNLVFNTPPSEAAKIEVFYFLDMPKLLSSFTLTSAPINGAVSVKVNGMDAKVTYDSGANSIVFDAPPEDGATIVAGYESEGAKVLQYDVIKNPEGHTLKEIIRKDGMPIEASLVNGQLTIAESDFEKGVEVIIITTTFLDQGKVKLLGVPLEGSLKVVENGCLEGEPTLSDEGDILLILCDQEDRTTKVRYAFEVDRKDSFDLVKEPSENALISISINKKRTKAYDIQGSTLSFKEPLPPGASIKYIEIGVSQEFAIK